MISNQETLNPSPHMAIYDIVVTKNNQLLQINDLVDFSFVYEELNNKYCLDNGHHAMSPIHMFKYLLLKAIFERLDIDVAEPSKYDMSFNYFLDTAPDDQVVDPSSLKKFRKLRLQGVSLVDLLIHKTIEIAWVYKLINSKTIIVDATHTKAHYNQKSTVEFLMEKSKNVRRVVS